MPLPVVAMPLARPISPRFQHHENPSARHAIANQPCGQPAISQHEPDFPRRQYQGEQDRDSEPPAFSASANGFHPARALLHGSFHIGRSIVSPRFRRKQTPRNLSTVIPGAGAAFAAKPNHHDPRRSLAEVNEATSSPAEQAHEETGFGTSPARFRAFIASIGRRITWIRPCRCQHQWQLGSGHDRHFHPRRVVACALRTSDGASIGTGLGHVLVTAPVAREQPLDIPEGIHRVPLPMRERRYRRIVSIVARADAPFRERSLHRMQAARKLPRGAGLPSAFLESSTASSSLAETFFLEKAPHNHVTRR